MAGKLKCLQRYVNAPRGLVFEEGQIFDTNYALRHFLLIDAPGCFEPYESEEKAIKTPPRDKAVKSAAVDK
jgi:hypothetical protein